LLTAQKHTKGHFVPQKFSKNISNAEGQRIEALRRQVGWVIGKGYPLPSRLEGLGSVVRSRKRFRCFLGAPEHLSLQYLSQILHFPQFWGWTIINLDVGLVYQRPAWCCRTYFIRLKRYSRSSGSISGFFLHSTTLSSLIPSPFPYLSFPFFFPISSRPFHLRLSSWEI